MLNAKNNPEWLEEVDIVIHESLLREKYHISAKKSESHLLKKMKAHRYNSKNQFVMAEGSRAVVPGIPDFLLQTQIGVKISRCRRGGEAAVIPKTECDTSRGYRAAPMPEYPNFLLTLGEKARVAICKYHPLLFCPCLLNNSFTL
ncbi:hypothetical protein O6H91_14G065700 [Diphasiastrum complanatum]|uniref:Uncharacterized protein n=1 Tax=Diphasiastrum complanatum TaxID=34168 RepID=A0ACC2BQA9_DIPCM|nr:hypothetical protein O6H91_14G065700 [Diphasiastrum complanatum]